MGAHGQVIGGDVRLALRRVEDQGVDGVALTHARLHRRGEARAALADHAGILQALDQVLGFLLAPVAPGLKARPFIDLAVTLDHDAHSSRPET